MHKDTLLSIAWISCVLFLSTCYPLFVCAQGQLEKAISMLNANDRNTVQTAIQQIGLVGNPSAIEPLANRIRHGLPKDLVELSVMTLMALNHPSAGAILSELTMHRRPNIRLIAIEAIVAVNPPEAESILLHALSDSHASVRAKAAKGLGEIGATGALDMLFYALDRGVMEASESIGKVVTPERVDHLLNYLNKLPFRTLSPALTEILRRDDIPLKTRLNLIVRLEEIATSDVKGLLLDFLANHGENAPKQLIRSIRNVVQQIAD